MPWFFFDIQDGHLVPDKTGLDLTDVETAQSHAVELAESVLKTRSETRHTHPWQVVIRDSQGELLGTVTSIQV